MRGQVAMLTKTLAAILAAFTCAQNCLPVFNELRSTPEKHFDRMRISIYTSLGAAAGVYMVSGVQSAMGTPA